MKTDQSKYFLAIIPPEPIQSRVQKIKEYFEQSYGSRGALRSPGHITLHMPFQWKTRKEAELIDILDQTTNLQNAKLELNGFGTFKSGSIFIKTEFSQALVDIQKLLVDYTKRRMNLFNSTHNKGFSPHITVASRDLKKEQFYKAWQEFENKEFVGEFTVDSFWLLKFNGKQWSAYKEFKFF